MAENRVIGRCGGIPWHIPDDLRRFRELTMGHPLIVGRKTFESIGRALAGRAMIVLTRQMEYRAEGCRVAHGLAEALFDAGGADEIFIAGGGEVFLESLPLADRIYLTVVHRAFDGEVTFPEIPAGFVETARRDVAGEPPYSFFTFERAERK